MNESLRNFNNSSIADKSGYTFAQEILDWMRERILFYQERTGNLYNLEATPAEATTYRLAKADKKLYPSIKVANEKEFRENNAAPYYTNSSHLPVGFTDDLFAALDLQDGLQTKYTGGTVFHSFLGQRISDSDIVKNLVRSIAHNYHLPYYTLTPTFSICPEHGYLSGEQPQCLYCGRKPEIFSRVVGYLRPVQQWNDGKKEEFKNRLEYTYENQGI